MGALIFFSTIIHSMKKVPTLVKYTENTRALLTLALACETALGVELLSHSHFPLDTSVSRAGCHSGSSPLSLPPAPEPWFTFCLEKTQTINQIAPNLCPKKLTSFVTWFGDAEVGRHLGWESRYSCFTGENRGLRQLGGNTLGLKYYQHCSQKLFP